MAKLSASPTSAAWKRMGAEQSALVQSWVDRGDLPIPKATVAALVSSLLSIMQMYFTFRR